MIFFCGEKYRHKVRSDGQQLVSKHALTVVICFVKKERGNNSVLTWCFSPELYLPLFLYFINLMHFAFFEKFEGKKILAKNDF